MLMRVLGRFTLRAAVAALGLMLISSASPAAAQDAPRSGTFEALWSLKGTAQELELGAGRKTSTFRHTGTITFRNAQGLVGTALASCLGLGDTARGDVGRCVWVLEGGDRIFSELSGQLAPGPESGTVRGSFVGGTGRFQQISGSYELDWVVRLTGEPGAFRAQTVRMSGSWKTP
jgi:hypothetical protein